MASWKSRGLTPRFNTARKLADYFGVSIDYLLDIPLGDRIKKAREKKGWTPEQLSDVAVIAVEAINLYEKGERKPEIERLQRIAAALGVPTTDLIDMETASEYTKLAVAKTETPQLESQMNAYCADLLKEIAHLSEEDRQFVLEMAKRLGKAGKDAGGVATSEGYLYLYNIPTDLDSSTTPELPPETPQEAE